VDLSGSAVYIFGIDQAESQPDIVFTLGSTQSTHHYTGTERFAYNALFFSATGLPADQTHTVNWIFNIDQSTGVGVQAALFDYAIVTSGTADATPQAPCVFFFRLRFALGIYERAGNLALQLQRPKAKCALT
jgi:hypothetical protein